MDHPRLDQLPLEIQMNIVSRLPTSTLRRLMLVNHRLSSVARPQFYKNSTISLRGSVRLSNFARLIVEEHERAIRSNEPDRFHRSQLLNFYHVRFNDYATMANREDIYTIITTMMAVRTLYFSRLNVNLAMPNSDMINRRAWNPEGQDATARRITVSPMPAQVNARAIYVNLCYEHRLVLQDLTLPPIEEELLAQAPINGQFLRFLSRFSALRSLTLSFSIPLTFDSILVNTRHPRNPPHPPQALQALELECLPRDGANFAVFGLPALGEQWEAQLPEANMDLQQLGISFNMVNPLFLDFISQHFVRLTRMTLIGETQNLGGVNAIFLQAPVMRNITHLEIRHQSNLHQILRGVMHAFPALVDLTLSKGGINAQVPRLNLDQLNLTTLHIDVNIIPGTYQSALIVETATHIGEVLHMIEVNQLPPNVFTVNVTLNGLRRLHLFDSEPSRRHYNQNFYFDR